MSPGAADGQSFFPKPRGKKDPSIASPQRPRAACWPGSTPRTQTCVHCTRGSRTFPASPGRPHPTLAPRRSLSRLPLRAGQPSPAREEGRGAGRPDRLLRGRRTCPDCAEGGGESSRATPVEPPRWSRPETTRAGAPLHSARPERDGGLGSELLSPGS